MRHAPIARLIPILIQVLLPVAAGRAQIQDNSFLIEEAYNQEPGIVQHIGTMSLPTGRASGPWAFSFTQEWPLRGLTHQLSYTIPVEHDGGTGLGDILLNYRWQAVGSGTTRTAVSPRASVLLPTGEAANGFGAGAVGGQVNLPVSLVLGRAFVAHLNAGATVIPRAKGPRDARATETGLNLGGSLIWLGWPRLNALLEVLWTREESAVAGGGTGTSQAWTINPGLRAAFDCASGLQVVPGVSVPIVLPGTAGAGTEVSVLLYLSLEHPFGRSRGERAGS